MIPRLLVVAAILLAGSASGGDDSSKPEIWPEFRRAQRQKREPKAKRFFLFAGTSVVGDSNVDHTLEGSSDTGVVPLAGLEFRNRSDRSRVNLGYTIASHHYSKSDTWDRTSHDFHASYESRASRRWRPLTALDVSLDGTAEDRDLADRYSLKQGLSYWFNRRDSVLLYAAYRQKDYLNDQLDSNNPFAGVEFQQEFENGHRWSLGYRYEVNRPQSFRHRYLRRTIGVEYRLPLGSASRLHLELKYRPRSYWRLVDVGDTQEPRHDRQWLVGTKWVRQLGEHFSLTVDYQLEGRTSNDPTEEFDAHRLVITLVGRV